MSGTANTQRVYQLLAASYPEPIDRADLVRRLPMPSRALERALAKCMRCGVVRPMRPMVARQGFAYTVVL